MSSKSPSLRTSRRRAQILRSKPVSDLSGRSTSATLRRAKKLGYNALMSGFMVVALLAVWVTIAVASCSGSSERFEQVKGDPEKLIGRLKWTITETATGKILGAGERDVRIGDAKVRTLSNPQFGEVQQLRVPLCDHFVAGLAQGADATQGFGITADRDDRPTFSWEWFVVVDKTATKLQESGELAVQIEGTQLLRADFTTDVSLRVIPMVQSADPREPTWRVEIAKGSYLSWPR